jgi:hypothetical protein
MKTTLFFLSVLLLFLKGVWAQVISINVARQLPLNTVVTIQGISLNGSELGNVRYLTDGTGAIAAYGTILNQVQVGDFLELTGALHSYHNLLELNPVSSVTVLSQGNALPPAQVITPSQLGEMYESHLVQINGAVFQSSGVFAGSANYQIQASGQTAIVRIHSQSNLVGSLIPAGNVNITAICTQFQNVYQLLPRHINDLQNIQAFYVTIAPRAQNITMTGLQVYWETNYPGNAFAWIGKTPLYELGIISGSVFSSVATIDIVNAQPAEVYYVKPFSVSGTDTAFTAPRVFITQSNSSGQIHVYFNRTVNHSVAWPVSNQAVYLAGTFADTLAAWIDRAELTLDIAIYNFNSAGTQPLINAINQAYQRGVIIRIIADGNNANSALAWLNPAIPVWLSPVSNAYYSIMHNKFMIIDAFSPDPLKPIVITGSVNWTESQLNVDANNLVIIQDQSLARVYTMEFEEMWGGNGVQPNALQARFGPDKSDNTPHQLNIGGWEVECYFSPSDNVNSAILKAIETSDSELYFALLSFTRTDLATAIADRITQHNVYAAGIANSWSGGGQAAFGILQNVMGPRVMSYNHATLPGILHHKYLIVDQADTTSDPLVLTGSNNWSTSAIQRNDENTLIIHHPAIANQYYQEFWQRFFENGGGILNMQAVTVSSAVRFMPNPARSHLFVLLRDKAQLSIATVEGKIVMSVKLRSGLNHVDVSSLPEGLYLLHFRWNDSQQTEKLVIID